MKIDHSLPIPPNRSQTRREWSLKTVRDRCEDVGDCWIWQQCCINGYPQASIDGKGGTMVRRWLWGHLHGDKPNGGGRWFVVSKCGSRLCCNPDHLKLASRSFVMTESWASGVRNRSAHALFHRERMIAKGWAKLTLEDARAIRADQRSAKDLAGEYGVGVKQIYAIRNGKAWRELASASSVFSWRG